MNKRHAETRNRKIDLEKARKLGRKRGRPGARLGMRQWTRLRAKQRERYICLAICADCRARVAASQASGSKVLKSY
jgi:hypothetical protein